MDPNKLAEMLASGDKSQVIAAQKQLQALGYAVKPDGKLGSETSQAMAAYRADKANERNSNVTISENQAKANDPLRTAAKLGVEGAPYAAGVFAGYGLSRGLKSGFDLKDKAIGDEVKRLANARGIDPKIALDEMKRLERGRTGRNLRQFGIPAAFLGGAELTRDYIAPNAPEEIRPALNLVASGEQGAGATLAVKQLYDALKRGNPVDSEDRARIRTRAQNADKPAVEAPAPKPKAIPAPEGTGEVLRHSDRIKLAVEASGGKAGKTKAANVAAIKKGLTEETLPAVAQALKLPAEATRPQVLQRLREISRVGGKLALPLTAGYMASELVGEPAEAADGSGPASNIGQKVAAGGAGAALYEGGRRALNALPAAANTALGAAGAMATPMMAADATDEFGTPEARNAAARYLPSFMHFGAVKEAADMSQVPERSPVRMNGRALSGPSPMAAPAQAPGSPNFEAALSDLLSVFHGAP